MPILRPRPLVENTRLAYLGERMNPAFGLTEKAATQMLRLGNPHGKPNANVLREVAAAPNFRRTSRGWQIDFPADMGEEEASLYQGPFHQLARSIHHKTPGWWANPSANIELRTNLARRERYLASPIDGAKPEFVWLDASLLPDSSLLVIARDDDFTHGIVQSHAFAHWWTRVHSRRTPTLAFESFPFPWPPRTALNALTAAQEEQRHALALAARGTDPAKLEAAIAAAYGWPAEQTDAELLARLVALTDTRERH